MKLTEGIIIKLMGLSLEHFAPWLGPGFLLALLGIAWLLDRYYDAAVRQWLSKRAELAIVTS